MIDTLLSGRASAGQAQNFHQLQAAGQASRARARSVIERNPKTASAPASNEAADSRLETAPVPAVPVPPPDIGLPPDIALPKPLGGSQELLAPVPEPSG